MTTMPRRRQGRPKLFKPFVPAKDLGSCSDKLKKSDSSNKKMGRVENVLFAWLDFRVARCLIFKPKIPIWVNL
jgi:hypothetical protein